LVRAPGQNAKIVGFGAVDWRDGWLSHEIALSRTAKIFCQQLDHLVARSQACGRIALVIADNLGIHTPRGSKLVRQTLARHRDALRLIYTPAYDPDANPIERLWRPFRRRVTHNHHRGCLSDLYDDAQRCFAAWDCYPRQVLSFVGSPAARNELVGP
jgi:transposase